MAKLKYDDEKLKKTAVKYKIRKGGITTTRGEIVDWWVQNRIMEAMNIDEEKFKKLAAMGNQRGAAKTKKAKQELKKFKQLERKFYKQFFTEFKKWIKDPKYKKKRDENTIIEKIDSLLVEKIMGRKKFEQIIDRIEDQIDGAGKPSTSKFWDKWDKKVGGDGTLYIDEIMWRIYDDRKLWNQFVKEWQKMGFEI